MKDFLKNKSNLFTLLVVVFVLWRQIPQVIKSFEAEGVKLESKTYSVISSTGELKEVIFPPLNKRALTIFWATWCGPCKIEMDRLQTSIKEGKISGSKIIAINPFEDRPDIKKFLSRHNYNFTFIDAPEVAKILNVEVTPTTVFFDKGKITSHSTGMSITGIWKAENFLD
jgi:cytochrome c biogenesis protein CcmG/thiol:disulfide interchange protein DsbE